MKGHPIPLRLTLVTLLLSLAAIEALAQSNLVRARVRSVMGIARIYAGPQSGAFAPKRNDPLEPGNIIETDQNGRVVISLSDGGQITVLPNSKVVLKNFLVSHSARELLDIVVGRVLVKIRKVGGKPNPYRLNSPAASIAVRGTEFIVDVLLGGETVVIVREGLVEVWPRNNPDNKRLAIPGGRVIVRPGGDISSAFPGPGSELNGRTRFYGDLENDYQRSVDSVAQSSNEISPVLFTAFADPHLDSLENPAYAAEFKGAEGRLSLLPSISAPYRLDVENNSSSTDPARFDHSVSPQLTFFTPIPGSRLVIGVAASALRTRLQNLTEFESPDYSYLDYQTLRLNASNASVIAAYNFGERGRTSAGISVDSLSGDGRLFSDHRLKSNTFILNDERLGNSNAQFARVRLTLGLVHRFSESKKIGLYYRHGLSSSDQEDQYQQKYEDQFRPAASYSLSGKTTISTLSSEFGIRFRAPLTRRLFYGVEGSSLHERIRSRRETLNQPVVHNRYLARRGRVGAGLGFFLTSKILLNFDIAGGLFYNTEPMETPPCFCGNIPAPFPSSQRGSRGRFLSTHAAIQTNLWRNLFLSASNLKLVRTDFLTYNSSDLNGAVFSFTHKNVYSPLLSNVGIGWNFKPNLAAEYIFSIDTSNRAPSHSIKLRYTFNLGGANEK